MKHLLTSKNCTYNNPPLVEVCAVVIQKPTYPLCDVVYWSH